MQEVPYYWESFKTSFSGGVSDDDRYRSIQKKITRQTDSSVGQPGDLINVRGFCKP